MTEGEQEKLTYYYYYSIRSLTMIIFWYLLLICSSIESQSIQNLTNKTLDLFAFDHRQITILGALTNNEHIQILNEHTNQLSREGIYLSSKSFILDLNPLLIAIKLCEFGNHSHAKAIIAGRGIDGNDLTLTAISYVSDFYHIPVLTIASRENLFSDKVKFDTIEI